VKRGDVELGFPSLFGKHLEKAECFAWKPKFINKAKEKKFMFEAK
jgi:hypothetical protein